MPFVSPAVSASGGDPPRRVEVAAVGGPTADVAPGEVVAARFVLSNPGEEGLAVEASAEVPAGWASLFAPALVELGPQAQALRLVSVRVPALAPPGTYMLRLVVRDPTGAASPAEAVLEVRVRPVRAVTVTPVEGAGEHEAGTAYRTSFLLANEGNVALTVRLDASVAGGTASPDVRTLRLERGASASIGMTVTAPHAVSAARGHTVWFTAMAGDEVVARASTRALVVPSRYAPPPRPSGYPVLVSVGAGGRGGGLGPQLQIASAPEQDARRRGVSFLLRPPSTQPASLYLPDDQYRLRYRDDRYTTLVGDQVAGLTPLTSTGQYGFGGSLRVDEADYAVEGYLLRSRLPGDGATQGGVRVEQQIEGIGLVGANFMAEGDDRGRQVGSLTLGRPLVSGTEAEAEVGLSSASGRAVGFRAAGRYPALRYEARLLQVEPDYLGPQRGLGLRAFSATARPLLWLDLDGSWRSTVRTFGDSGPSRRERLVRGGVGIRGRVSEQQVHASVALQERSLEAGAEGRRWERSIEARGGVDVRRTIQLDARVASGWVRLTETSTSFARLEGRMRIQRGVHTVHASLGYTQGADLFVPRLGSRWQMTAQWAGRVGRRTEYGLHAYYGREQSRSGWRYAALQFQLSHELRQGHRLAVRGRLSEAGSRPGGRDAAYAVSYTVPIYLSTSREKQVAGQVVHAETAEPIAGAMLRLGNRTVRTGADGSFTFPAPTGVQYLRLDPTSIEGGLVVTRSMPIRIDEEAVPTESLLITVLQGGSLEGRVVLYEFPFGASREEAVEVGGLPHVVLEVEDEVGRSRAVSDATGAFRFSDLRPGRWRVRVVHALVPERHVLGEEEVEVVVGAGERKALRFEVRPQQRAVRLHAGGSVRLDGAGR